jgi:hypothetical protein
MLTYTLEAAESDSFAKTALYPPLKPYDEGYIKVDGRHTIYYHCYGNKTGKPVLFVHGGPGGGTQSAVRYSIFLQMRTTYYIYSVLS